MGAELRGPSVDSRSWWWAIQEYVNSTVKALDRNSWEKIKQNNII